MQHELVRVALEGGDSVTAIDDVVEMLPDDVRAVYQPLLAPSWTPKHGEPGNFAQVLDVLRTAVNRGAGPVRAP